MSSGWGGNGLQNGKGRLTYAYTNTSSSPTTGTQLSYDVMGRPTWVFECAPLTCGTSASTAVYAYNYLGEATSMLDNDSNRTLSYAYNAAGQFTGLTSTQAPTTILSNVLYNALGEVTSETRADVGNTTNSYDNRGRLTAHAAGSSYSLSLGYSSSNNVTSLTDSINGTWTYGYAAHFTNRLGTATCTANCPAGASPFSYAYDQFGNRWGTINGVNQYIFNANNHITNNGVVYDAVGNMTSDGLGNTYTYDAESRMIAMNSNYTATYDALGNRVEETITGITNDYIFGLNGRILHYNVPGSRGLGEDVYANGEHIGLYAGGNLHMLHHDQVNSVRKWTVYSGGVWSSDQTVTNGPFGDALTPVGNPESDHDYFGDYIQDPDGEFKSPTRRLSGTQGRWSTPDPAGLAAVDPSNPQTWNRYAYVANNPLSYRDPLGLFMRCCNEDDGGGGDPFGSSGGDPCFLYGMDCPGGGPGDGPGGPGGGGGPRGPANNCVPGSKGCFNVPQRCANVPTSPPGASSTFNANLVSQETQGMWPATKLDYFYQTFKTGGTFDYKAGGQDQYVDYGNWNFGYVCGANYPGLFCQSAAGGNRMWRAAMQGTNPFGSGFPFLKSPYGDQAADNQQIQSGIQAQATGCVQ